MRMPESKAIKNNHRTLSKTFITFNRQLHLVAQCVIFLKYLNLEKNVSCPLDGANGHVKYSDRGMVRGKHRFGPEQHPFECSLNT